MKQTSTLDQQEEANLRPSDTEYNALSTRRFGPIEGFLVPGTEKYPADNEFSKFLNEHGGSYNAHTKPEHTNYHFDVAPPHLGGALDRFAQFFLAPLFTESATEREISAINSENDENIMNDLRRILQVEKETMNCSHPYSKFDIGNRDTLLTIPQARGQDICKELLKFYDKYYSSNLMTLAVLGEESIDELSEMVVPLFSLVEDRQISVPTWPGHPIQDEHMHLQMSIVPIKDERGLSIAWPIDDLSPHYKSNPAGYLSHLISRQGHGSLSSELMSRGWVNSLIGWTASGGLGFMFFKVCSDLTEEGIKNTDKIIHNVFSVLEYAAKRGYTQMDT